MAEPIIDLQITVSKVAPERPGFGVPMIAGFHERFPERSREYAQAKDMIDDGFEEDDPEYQLALIVKSQDPSPTRFKVGRLEAAGWTHTVRLTPTNVTAGLVYTGEINGEDAAVTVDPSDTVALIVDKVVAIAGPITNTNATDNTTSASVVAATPNTLLSFKGLSEHYKVEDITVVDGEDLQADLNEILDEDSDWYELLLTINCPDSIEAATAWTEANGKTFVYQTADTTVIDAGVTNDVASTLMAQSYTRTAGIWHRDIGGDEWANGAFGAVNLSMDPGSYTPAFKSLVGITADKLRQGAKTALAAKNVTRYTVQNQRAVTYEGKTPSGQFFDVVRFIDWLDYTIEADLFDLLANNPKVPYDTAGITMVKSTIEISLQKGITAGGLDGVDEPPVVNVPTLAETTPTDRSQRILRNVTFTARLTGALHGIAIRGTVSV